MQASDCGAVATFVGLVRDHNAGRQVLWLDYEAYAPLAIATFERIGNEAAERWPAVRLAIHHRTGRVEIGEASVVIVAASPHRADAFSASRYAIERVKQVAPVWKHEHFVGGDVWIEGAARHRGAGCGALVTFVGVVRATHQDRRVRHLEYEAFEPHAG